MSLFKTLTRNLSKKSKTKVDGIFWSKFFSVVLLLLANNGIEGNLENFEFHKKSEKFKKTTLYNIWIFINFLLFIVSGYVNVWFHQCGQMEVNKFISFSILKLIFYFLNLKKFRECRMLNWMTLQIIKRSVRNKN